MHNAQRDGIGGRFCTRTLKDTGCREHSRVHSASQRTGVVGNNKTWTGLGMGAYIVRSNKR